MDLVECEAPLDNSFQKERLELVSKGSLGRRRKPSRSNLRLILSPADDRQDIDVFHRHQQLNSEGIFAREKVTPSKYSEESLLDNRLEPATLGQRRKYSHSQDFPESCHLSLVSGSGQTQIVTPANRIRSVKCIDLNGNNQQPDSSSNYSRTFNDVEEKTKSRQPKSKSKNTSVISVSSTNNHRGSAPGIHEWTNGVQTLDNNVNTKCHTQTTVYNNQHNGNICNRQESAKLSNGYHLVKSNSNHSDGNSKSQKAPDFKNRLQEINIRNQQQSAASQNHQSTIIFSNHRQIITSTPVQSKKTAESRRTQRGIPVQDCSSQLYIEPSLPRTSKEPDLVAEARQFSIEAKLKRKNSDVQGRSAVLIQTWERRTQSESHSKLRRDSKTVPQNRFSGKENCGATAMPDSYICMKYKGSLQTGDNLQRGEMVAKVRDARPEDAMLYRAPEDRPGRTHPPECSSGGVTVNGNATVQEPEWISLSRKLCAKFVEGHIEPHSPDSYPHEEPEGVGEKSTSSPLPSQTSSRSNMVQVDGKRNKVPLATTTSEEAPSSDEPPWIHLSRKLCNKFIEEHIEYPPITNGHLVEVPELVEPNGDVRIIEKIGKPKGRKSKQKKECEPEWVSLSKKLRAKFIESHIDDPDTIALDNQLNASDPDETGSESLSDISQDTSAHKATVATPVECKSYTARNPELEANPRPQENDKYRESDRRTESNDHVPPVPSEKECCWDYQEMEFDQESNSGNFQESEYYDQPLQEVKTRQGSPFRDNSETCKERVTFANSSCFQNPECFNNDVKFAPRFVDNPGSPSVPESPSQSKLITVQFIAHSVRDRDDEEDAVSRCDNNSNNDSFFNVSAWEEAHYQQEEEDDEERNFEKHPMQKDFRSKSLDNLCDSLEEQGMLQNGKQNSLHIKKGFNSVENFLSAEPENVPKESLSSRKDITFQREYKTSPDSSFDSPATKESASCNCICDDTVSESENNFAPSGSFCCDEREDEFYDKQIDSSSEDEVFESVPNHKSAVSNNSHESMQHEEMFTKETPHLQKERDHSEKQVNNDANNDRSSKSIKCNGMIPNSIYDGFPDGKKASSRNNQREKNKQDFPKEPVKMGMSKWITMSKSEQNISKPEYSNIQPFIEKEQKPSERHIESTSKPKKNRSDKKSSTENESASSSKIKSTKNGTTNGEKTHSPYFARMNGYTSKINGTLQTSDLKTKCKSLCDISNSNNSKNTLRQHESVADLCSKQMPNHSEIEFQHFEGDSEIPLCAKLVSNHDKRISRNIPSGSPSYRTDSPCPSESSHVYEDMFKETPSGPSDSEASSWTAVVKNNNTYYVNGRSSSMNDLDFSDSCSMSVKCDYASSSDNSTLQSRHSSYASSSFYVNLRDYDSHMLEPSLGKSRKDGDKPAAGMPSSASKSNPPTPESLRHLFTSPLTSIHAPPNRNSRLLTRMPSDPQSHYYSTAAATSSAFKHGFAPTPPKPKKTERSSSVKIKDIAHGIILTFKRLQSHSKNSSLNSVDVSHLAEMKSNSESGKAKKGQKDSKFKNQGNEYWTENGRNDSDSGFLSDVQRAKARRSSSDLSSRKSNSDIFQSDKKKSKSSKKGSNREKGKKSKGKVSEPRTIPTVSRKVQQMADGTFYLVTTVSGDTNMPGVYSDSPDTSSELSSHRPVKHNGESNC